MKNALALVAALAQLACDGAALDTTDDAERSAGSGVLDLVLDPEQPADDLAIGGIGTISGEVQIAWSGTRFLAVWPQQGTGLRVARIAADGSPIDEGSVHLAYGSTPTVAFFGGFLVAIDEGSVVELWRVGQQGAISRIGYVAPSNRGKLPDIAGGSSEAMIVFNDDGLSESRIFSARYDGNAVSPVVQLGNGVPLDARPHIAYRPGGDYLAVWENAQGNLRGRFVSPANVPGLAFAISSADEEEGAPAVAFAGSSYVVVWRAVVPGGMQIRGALVSPAGEVGAPVDVSSVMPFADRPSISCNLTCTVLWSGGRDAARTQLWGRRLGADLESLGAEAIAVSGPGAQGPAELAGPEGGQYLVWLDDRSGLPEVYGTVAPGGDELEVEPAILPIGANQTDSPAIAASSDSWLVAWSDTRMGGRDLFGRRFDFDGVPQTPSAQPIHDRPGLQERLDLAWNGSQFLAAWDDGYVWPAQNVRVTRIDGNGAVLDPDGITVGHGFRPDVAAGGAGGWLVGWSRGTGSVVKIQAAVVRPDGTSTAPLDVSFVGSFRRVAYDPAADLYLLLWAERQEDWTTVDLRAVRIASDGSAILDPAPVTLATLPSQFDVEVAFGAGLFLVVLENFDDDRLLALRVALGPDGIEVLDPAPFALDAAPGTQRSPAVTFTAKSFLVAYEWWQTGISGDIHGVQVSPAGAVQGSAFALVDSPSAELSPAFAGTSQRRALLAFTRLERLDPNDILPGSRYRVFVRRLVIGLPDGATCTGDAQCESGSCVGGFCCGPNSCP